MRTSLLKIYRMDINYNPLIFNQTLNILFD